MKIRELLKKMSFVGDQEVQVSIFDNLGGVDLVWFTAKEINYPKIYKGENSDRLEDILNRRIYRVSFTNNVLSIDVKSKVA